jgi:exoribonuclease II
MLEIKTEKIKNIRDNRFFGRVSDSLDFDGFSSYFIDCRQLKKIMHGMSGFAAAKASEKINRQELRRIIEIGRAHV